MTLRSGSLSPRRCNKTRLGCHFLKFIYHQKMVQSICLFFFHCPSTAVKKSHQYFISLLVSSCFFSLSFWNSRGGLTLYTSIYYFLVVGWKTKKKFWVSLVSVLDVVVVLEKKSKPKKAKKEERFQGWNSVFGNGVISRWTDFLMHRGRFRDDG